MSKGNIYLYSPVALEPWDWRNPDTKGIGGSETSHIEIAKGLALRGYDVWSYTHLPELTPEDPHPLGPNGSLWYDIKTIDDLTKFEKGIWIIYRDIHFLNKEKPPNTKYWFIAQDVIYDFTEEQIAKIDRYICLCKTHAAYTVEKFPSLKDKIYISTNGIRRDLIEAVESSERIIRDPYRLIYTSSPDRGLALILENWFRIKERVPQATLHVYYGFNNMDEIINKLGGVSDLVETKRHLMDLMLQAGITFKGRANQPELVAAMLEAQLWTAPHSWPETSPVAGDTLIETLEGKKQIKDLIGKEFYVYSCNKEGKLSISKAKNVKCTRQNTRTVRLTYKALKGNTAKKEKYLVLTPDHEVMLADGTYLPSVKLKIGDKLKAFSRRRNEFGNGYDTLAVTYDGAVPEHRFVASFFAGRKLKKGEVVDHIDKNKKNNKPCNLVIHLNQSIHVKSHFKRLTEEERQEFCSIKAKEYEERANKYGEEWMRAWHQKGAYASASVRSGENHKIIKIEEWESQDVYCMEVEPDHNFVANDIFVHNCITCMEMQACGCVPITNNHWALKDNIFSGVLLPCVPQENKLMAAIWVEEVIRTLQKYERCDKIRKQMMEDARQTFSWDKIIDNQLVPWIEEDLRKISL